ncbi:MAG: hypothetical protein AVO33_00235 [delta proteobacterium ML8_F1]|nr:MAG: hypothetical protein AVO33_00235 [delta proteobacterium ML8_F1]
MRRQCISKPAPLTALLLGATLLITGCSSPAVDLMEGIEPSPPAEDSDTLDRAALKSLNDFTWNLLKASPEDSSNRMLSPVSVYLALAMTLNGAEGETRADMLVALSASDLTPEMINTFARKYLESITPESEEAILSVANSIWLREGFEVDPAFLQKNADYFGAGVRSLDFNAPEAPEIINDWVSEATRETIDEIVKEIDPAVVMYLINAIYFKADWQTQFSSENTYPQPFETPEGSKETDFMHKTLSLETIQDDLGKGILMPYADTGMAMLALLPEGGLSPEGWIKSMDTEGFHALLKTKASKSVDLAFPKFETSYEASLVNELEALGMGSAFDPGKADFSLMQPSRAKDLFISALEHKTFIRADESGTEAAAVTSVEMTLTAAPMIDETMVFDEPFVYAILDTRTGTPLFVGTLYDPTD